MSLKHNKVLIMDFYKRKSETRRRIQMYLLRKSRGETEQPWTAFKYQLKDQLGSSENWIKEKLLECDLVEVEGELTKNG